MALCGLANTSSTCYINTVIQCIRACDRLCALFKPGNENPLRVNEKHAAAVTDLVVLTFARLLEEMDKTPEGGGIHPETFLATFARAVPYMDVFSQNDMHEAFITLWNRMNEEVAWDVGTGTPDVCAADTPYLKRLRAKCDSKWWAMLGKEHSPLVDAVFGQQIVQIECGACRYIHHNYQPFNVLELPIPVSDAPVSMSDCMLAAFRTEVLNQWTCSNCKKTVDSQQTTHLWRTPPVLIVCLKRFVPHQGRLQKNDTRVLIHDTLSLCPISQSTEARPLQYRLKSVGHHTGNLSYGHYFATCLVDGRWKVMNDMLVRDAGAERVHITEKSSYMMFYERI